MPKTYAGIGSRRTPSGVLRVMERLAADLAGEGYLLRSGNAKGADTAFQTGAGSKNGLVRIFLPWPKFNGGCIDFGRNTLWLTRPSDAAMAMAESLHPRWDLCGDAARLLHARNAHQVLGPNLDSPVNFVVCWTPDGAESEAECSVETGGTGMAIRIASRNKIPVFNLRNPDAEADLVDQLGLIPF